jgi:DNA replication protein DnaC
MNLDKVKEALLALHLKNFAEILEETLRKAEREKLSPADILYLLASQEIAARQQRLVKTRILQACFPTVKTIDAFDFSFPKAINKPQILNLLDLTFVNQKK